MTFVAYARARRLGAALKAIRAGEPVIAAQLEAGYESGSGFRDAFAKILGAPPASGAARALFAAWLDTPLGPIKAETDAALTSHAIGDTLAFDLPVEKAASLKVFN